MLFRNCYENDEISPKVLENHQVAADLYFDCKHFINFSFSSFVLSFTKMSLRKVIVIYMPLKAIVCFIA